VTGKGGLESLQHRSVLFAPCREDAAQTAEGVGSRLATVGPGDLLLDFGWAQVAPRLMVVEGHGELVEEGQHFSNDTIVRLVERVGIAARGYIARRYVENTKGGCALLLNCPPRWLVADWLKARTGAA
jgi:hypothetical protein